MWIFYFLWYPVEAFHASTDGILLWFYQLLPTLFPYAVLSSVILGSNLILELTRYFADKRQLLGVFPAEWFVILFGFLFGFPIGSKLTADLYQQGLLSRKRAQILCSFTNNMSPLFVTNYVLYAQLNRSDLRLWTYLLLYGIPLLWGIIRLACSESESVIPAFDKKPASGFHCNIQILDTGIMNSFTTLIRLCGYIVMFSLMARMCLHFIPANPWFTSLCTGILEITNGIATTTGTTLPFAVQYVVVLCMLSFGGISGIAQTMSLTRDTPLSILTYTRDKCIQCILTLVGAAILLLCGIII